ncbi:hypothetical protein BASA81_000071 [Batrachochytrium salamandrivorans]|nr:hypothetical protein BASA81_000071 [Batrachochytrium salamandrivorans]
MLGYLGLGYLAARGVPGNVKPRALGGEEHLGEPQRDDERWKFRGFGVDHITELTQVPVRITADSPASKTKFKLDFSEYDVVVIGGAAAGLSAAACLERRGVKRVLVVEKNETVGDIWRSRYHRLHLHDIAEECSLPGFDLPKHFPKFPTREQFASYLEAYALCKRINITYLTLVKNVRQQPGSGKWEVELEDLCPQRELGQRQIITCKHVVLCNGVYNDPFVPKIPIDNGYTGLQVHSSRYTNGTELGLKGKRVLVVGYGNSAAEIAVDLVEHGAKVPTVLIRSEVTIVPRWAVQRSQEVLHTHVLPLLSVPFGWAVVGLGALLVDPMSLLVQQAEYGGKSGLAKLGLPLSWKLPVTRAVLDKEPPVMDVGTIDCARRGLLRMKQGEIEAVDGLKVSFKGSSNNEPEEFDCIVWATGYNMFQGHRHLFDPELFAKVGNGVDGLLMHRALPGLEHAEVKGLWLNYGRIQMVNHGAHLLAKGIAQDLGVNGGENDLVDAGESWSIFLAKHAAVAGVGYYVWKSKL